MARQVLIVEDNDGVAHLLAELCRELGVEAVRAKGGTEAIALLAQKLPDVVLLDLVLEELDGFQVANALRAQPGGEALPLVVVSGVYKKLPDAFAERVKPQFVAKPFEPAAIRRVLESLVGTLNQAAGITRGRFGAQPPLALMLQLYEKRATGVLDIVAGEVRRRLFFQGGQVRFAQSNVRAEQAGGMQVASGQLASDAFDRAVAHAKQARVPLHEALVVSGAMTAEAAQGALRGQTLEVSLQALASTSAEWQFSAADVDKVPDAKRSPVLLLVDHARRAITPEAAREALLARSSEILGKTATLDRELFALRAAWSGETVTALAVNRTTIGELVERARPMDLPFAWALLQAGLFTGSPAVSRSSSTAFEPAVDAVDLDAGRHFSEPEETAREWIFAEQRRTESLNHYELLGISPKGAVDDARRTYLELARRYHSDSYAGLSLGRAAPILAHLFQHLNEAMDTLADEKRRAEYDIYLDRKAKGLPTDVGAILRAEELFQRAEVLIKANSNKAQEALDLMTEALALNSSEPEFHAYYGYALYRVKGAPAAEEARSHLQKALKEAPDLASAYVLQGLMARDAGQDKDAISNFQKALERDPKHEQANRELRAVRHRLEKEAGGNKSIFSKLFGR